MEAELIALVPSALLLGLFIGGIGIYLVMIQQKILALARIPRRQVVFYNVSDGETWRAIREYERIGFRGVNVEWDRAHKKSTITMELAV